MKTKQVLLLIGFLMIHFHSFGQSKSLSVVKTYYATLDNGGGVTFDKILAAGFLFRAPISPEPTPAAGIKMIAEGFKIAFPDMKHSITDWTGDNKKLAVKGLFTGTNTGPLQGNPPSGNKVMLPFQSIFSFDANLKITNLEVQFDNFSFINQLNPGMPTAETIKRGEQNIRALFDLMDAGAIDKFGDYISADFKIKNPFTTELCVCDLAEFKGMIQGQKAGFPDLKHEVVSIISDGVNVISSGYFKGTNTGPFMGMPATGNKVNAPYLVWDLLDANGKLKKRSVQFDVKGFEQQLMRGKVTEEILKKNINTAYNSLNKRDYNKFKTVCAPNFTEYAAGPAPIMGADAAIEAYKMYFALAPDINFEINKITIDGNRAIVETKTTGTNTGVVMGILPATGKKIMTHDVDIITFDAEGKVLSHNTTNPNEIFYQIGYGALANPNTALVMGIYEKFGKGDIAGIAATCADNVSFDISDNPFVKKPKVYTNNKDMIHFFEDLNTSGTVTKFEPIRFLADGDDVVSYINIEFKSKPTGKILSSTFNHHFHIVNGKVTKFKEITTSPMISKGHLVNN